MKKILLIICFAAAALSAQELQATVEVNYEQLPGVNKESLVDFKQTIENYLNETQFTEDAWEYDRIPCSFNIFFTAGSPDFKYQAQVIVRSIRNIYNSTKTSPMLVVNDNSWHFKYELNETFYFDPNSFQSVASFLDYYAFVIIGLEEESWEKMTGQEYFNQAFQICNIARNSNYNVGWVSSSGSYSRFDLVENILNEKYRPFREATSLYHYGLDLAQEDRAKGQEYMVKMVNVLEELKSKIDVRSVYVRTFFDAKGTEIVDYLRDYPDKTIFETLKSVDPQRMSKYDEAMNE